MHLSGESFQKTKDREELGAGLSQAGLLRSDGPESGNQHGQPPPDPSHDSRAGLPPRQQPAPAGCMPPQAGHAPLQPRESRPSRAAPGAGAPGAVSECARAGMRGRGRGRRRGEGECGGGGAGAGVPWRGDVGRVPGAGAATGARLGPAPWDLPQPRAQHFVVLHSD